MSFVNNLRTLFIPEDDIVPEPLRAKRTPIDPPHCLRDDVREMSDADIAEFATWAHEHGQSAGLGIDPTERTLDIVMDTMFTCQRCGRCCRGPLLDGIAIVPGDVRRIANHMGMPPGAVLRTYTGWTGGPAHGVMPYPCPFYAFDQCAIYTDRPLVCRVFPLDLSFVETAGEIALQMFCPAARDLWITTTKERRDYLISVDGPAPRRTAAPRKER